MSRVITFSTKFPSTHPKKGEPTFFVEKMYNSLYLLKVVPKPLEDIFNFKIKAQKHHTMRSGNRWKVGDKFSPRIWSGMPYKSKQIVIDRDIEIKKIFDVTVKSRLEDGERLFQVSINGKTLNTKEQYAELAKNDGLSETELLDWFWNPKKPFVGQIICWHDSVKY